MLLRAGSPEHPPAPTVVESLRRGLIRALVASALAAVALIVGARPASAQTVFEVQGGGSSLTGGYGVATNVWRNGVEGWVGLGYLDGLRLGAFMRKSIGKDTLRIGNDALVVRYPTDVFGNGYNLLVQGASYARTQGRTGFVAFGGASSEGLAAPAFLAARAQAPMGALFVQHSLSPTLRLSTTAIVAEHQAVVPGIQWQATPDVTAALVAGTGSGRPYGAASLVARSGRFGFRGSYVYNPSRFRRAPVPAPLQTDVDRENLEVTYQLTSDFSIGVGRQHFIQDSADVAVPSRAWGNSIFLGGRTGELRISAGIYDSHTDSVSNLSSFVALGRNLASWLDGELFVLQSRPQGRAVTTTPILSLRERVSPRVGLVQQITVAEGRPRAQFGGSLLTAIGDFALDYTIVHQPFQPFSPFRSALNITARLQLGRYSTNLGTYVQPDGTVDYAASGSTFLYMGQLGGVQPQRVGSNGGIARYVVRGRVLDEAGQPVEGAAIDFDGETVFTNARGEFLLRLRQPRRLEPHVLLNEFLLPGRWRVNAVPERVQAQPEDRARPVEIRLERAVPIPALPDSIRPEPSDTLLPLVPPGGEAAKP
ncbi:MAG TPA: hypothetical protein VL287_16315 [Gemmatimonadales bacterium]|nr:hypothetical protein [Gemmatimonadales bacterium]